jgi:hypothetical protein
MAESVNAAQQSDSRKLYAQFVGSWSLISFQHVLSSGELVRPFGGHPSGLILYQSDGHMSAQIAAEECSKFANQDPSEASNDEASKAWRAYLGYWGTFEVNPERLVVVHRVKGSSFPNWIGTEQVRHFRFDVVDQLTLEAQSPSGRSVLLWRKVSGGTSADHA